MLPLVPVLVQPHFLQWGLDFIGEIHPPLSSQHRWILTATYYFTKWLEAILVKNATDTVVIKFIEEYILSSFGCPRQRVTDNIEKFNSTNMIEFCQKYQVLLHHSTPYYPQGNGLTVSLNKGLVKVIKKTLEDHKRSWNNHVIYALWDNKNSLKRSIGKSPFQLVYGKEDIFPTCLSFPVKKFL